MSIYGTPSQTYVYLIHYIIHNFYDINYILIVNIADSY